MWVFGVRVGGEDSNPKKLEVFECRRAGGQGCVCQPGAGSQSCLPGAWAGQDGPGLDPCWPPAQNHTSVRVPSHDYFEKPLRWTPISAECGRSLRSLYAEVGCDPGP